MKVAIKLNTGEVLETEIRGYKAEEWVEKLNDQSINAIAVGDHVLQRYAITQIGPVKEVVDTNNNQ